MWLSEPGWKERARVSQSSARKTAGLSRASSDRETEAPMLRERVSLPSLPPLWSACQERLCCHKVREGEKARERERAALCRHEEKKRRPLLRTVIQVQDCKTTIESVEPFPMCSHLGPAEVTIGRNLIFKGIKGCQNTGAEVLGCLWGTHWR